MLLQTPDGDKRDEGRRLRGPTPEEISDLAVVLARFKMFIETMTVVDEHEVLWRPLQIRTV
jgi:hypothetical protein